MAESCRFPKSVWSDENWTGLTSGAQLLAIACFMFRKSGAVTNRRIQRKTGWDMEFIERARREVEESAYAHWLIGITKRRRVPTRLANAVKERDGWKCIACGSTKDLQIDHIYPVSKGGSDDMDNLQTLCGPHNREKGARLDWEVSSADSEHEA